MSLFWCFFFFFVRSGASAPRPANNKTPKRKNLEQINSRDQVQVSAQKDVEKKKMERTTPDLKLPAPCTPAAPVPLGRSAENDNGRDNGGCETAADTQQQAGARVPPHRPVQGDRDVTTAQPVSAYDRLSVLHAMHCATAVQRNSEWHMAALYFMYWYRKEAPIWFHATYSAAPASATQIGDIRRDGEGEGDGDGDGNGDDIYRVLITRLRVAQTLRDILRVLDDARLLADRLYADGSASALRALQPAASSGSTPPLSPSISAALPLWEEESASTRPPPEAAPEADAQPRRVAARARPSDMPVSSLRPPLRLADLPDRLVRLCEATESLLVHVFERVEAEFRQRHRCPPDYAQGLLRHLSLRRFASINDLHRVIREAVFYFGDASQVLGMVRDALSLCDVANVEGAFCGDDGGDTP